MGNRLPKELPPSEKVLMEVAGEGDVEELIEVPEGQEELYLAATEESDVSIQWGSPQTDQAEQVAEEAQEAKEDDGVIEVVQAIANRTDPEPSPVPSNSAATENSQSAVVVLEESQPAHNESAAVVPEQPLPAQSENLGHGDRSSFQAPESDLAFSNETTEDLLDGFIPAVTATTADFVDAESTMGVPAAVSMKRPGRFRGCGTYKTQGAGDGAGQSGHVLPVLGVLRAMAMLASFSSAAQGLARRTKMVLSTGSLAPHKELMKTK